MEFIHKNKAVKFHKIPSLLPRNFNKPLLLSGVFLCSEKENLKISIFINKNKIKNISNDSILNSKKLFNNYYLIIFKTFLNVSDYKSDKGRYNIELQIKSKGNAANLFFHEIKEEKDYTKSFPSAKICICMATYNPDENLFLKQLDSIEKQQEDDFICIISDDASSPRKRKFIRECVSKYPRFFLVENDDRVGFYYNFQRCLGFVPEECKFVSLSDQDDYWYPDKLKRLQEAFKEDTNLVFGDMRVVSDSGQVVNESFWENRKIQHQSMEKLLMANVVSGAASMFRRELLDKILPFPQYISASFHDHWIALCCIHFGKINFVNHVLQDYVQHSNNVIGAGRNLQKNYKFNNIWYFIRGFLPWILPKRLRKFRYHGETFYLNDIVRLELLSRSLSAVSDNNSFDEFSIIKRNGLLKISIRAFLSNFLRLSTLHAESQIIQSFYWKVCCENLHSGFYTEKIHEISGELKEDYTENDLFSAAEYLKKKISSVKFNIIDEASIAVNLLIPSFAPEITYGGYITKFYLARLLEEAGYNVRLLIVDDDIPTDIEKSSIEISKILGDKNLFSNIEIINISNRDENLISFSPNDRIIATTWWTAHIANAISSNLKENRFFYLIQEYEPFTFPNGSFKATAEESYNLPHYPIYSSSILKSYFEEKLTSPNHLKARSASGVSFNNPITQVYCKSEKELSGRENFKILLYCRPDAHASRNLFELALLGLDSFLSNSNKEVDYVVSGVGSSASKITEYEFSENFILKLYPKMKLHEYSSFVASHDIGIALMHTPHPSLVPIEFASGGLVTVTTSYENKDQEYFDSISPNIIVAKPTIKDLETQIRNAAFRCGDTKARIQNAKVKWPTVKEYKDSLKPILEFIQKNSES